MKINIFSYVFWPEYFLVNELAGTLAKKGHKVSVQTSLPNYQTGRLAPNYSFLTGPYLEKYGDVEIYRYPVIPRKNNFIFLALNYITNVISGLINLIRLPKGDIYFFYATSPLLFILPVVFLKKITKKPLVIWYQDLWPDSFFAVTGLKPKGILLKLLNLFVRYIYENTDLMLLQSPAFAENLMRYNFKGRHEILYNWAPSVSLPSTEPEWLSALPHDKFILTFAGNLGKVQALNHVVEAAVRLQTEVPEVHIALVGDGSYLEDLKTQIRELNLANVGLYGRKPVEDMPSLFKKSDALLVSLKDDSTFNAVVPSKIQAYMAAGKPIVAFLNGVGAQVVKEAKCGVVIAAEDQNMFVEKLKKLVKLSKSERSEMGKNGLVFFMAHFEKNESIAKLEKWLNELVERRK